jgi:predicted permease
VPLTFLQLGLALAAGLALQRHPARERLVRLLWVVSFHLLGPVTAFYAFSVLPLERRTALLTALVAATCWSSLAVGYVYGVVAGRDLRERATLALPIAFWNTGYVGYVLARALWGEHGFALMVFFDQVGFLVPAVVISTAIARSHGGSERGLVAGDLARRLVLNPPLAGAVAAIALRLAGGRAPGLSQVGHAVGAFVGPFGFLLLGLSLPLAGSALRAGELRRGLAALVLRYAAGPLLLAVWGALIGVRVPPVFYLAALTPAAAHLLVLARIFSLRPALMRLLVIGSTALTLTGVACTEVVRLHA